MVSQLPLCDDDRQLCIYQLLVSATRKGMHEKIFDAVNEAIMVFDHHMRVVLVNDAAARIYGEKKSYQGRKCSDIFQSGSLHCDKYPAKCWIKKVLDTGQALRTITSQSLDSGETLQVAISASPVHDDARQVRHVVVQIRDVTCEVEYRQAKEDIAGQRLLCEYAPDGIVMVDADGTITNVNETWLMLFGYTRQEVVHKLNICAFLTPDQKFFCDHALRDLDKGSAVRCAEIEWRCKDGSSFWSNAKALPLPKGSNGSATGIISIRHIDDLPLDEDEIDQPGRFTKTLLDSIGDGVLVLDTQYRILNANRRFVEIHNTKLQNSIGRHCYEVSHDSDVPCWLMPEGRHHCPVRAAIETGKAASEVHVHGGEKGEKHLVEVKAFPMKDKNGEVFQIIETITDITEKKKLENLLVQAEKMESIGNMAGGIAHDLNNILTPILCYAQLGIATSDADNAFHEYFQQIRQAAQRAAELVRQILAFSRRQALDKKTLHINTVINDLKKMLDRVIREDVTLETDFGDDLWLVNADQTQIEQVIINLVVNARDAMPGGGKILLKTRNVERQDSICHTCGEPMAGPYVLLQVSDEGQGIQPEILPHIFEPFFTTKEKGQGTGMGLATIIGIMHQHDGHINVYSEPGMGTRFMVHLPRHESATAFQDQEFSHADLENLAGAGETILVVDDNKSVREMVETILVKWGYTVVATENGEAAAAIFARNPDQFDLVLTDIIMPGMGGQELINRIHELKPGMPALFMSGYGLNAVHHKFILEKGIEYLQKPPTIEDLLKKVKSILTKGKDQIFSKS